MWQIALALLKILWYAAASVASPWSRVSGHGSCSTPATAGKRSGATQEKGGDDVPEGTREGEIPRTLDIRLTGTVAVVLLCVPKRAGGTGDDVAAGSGIVLERREQQAEVGRDGTTAECG